MHYASRAFCSRTGNRGIPTATKMRFPWANIALIALFVAELVTGYLGLTHSNPE